LRTITVDANNKFYTAENNVLYNKNETQLIRYAAGMEQTVYNIPESVTTICYAAFQDAKNLVSISIPDSVKDIDHKAFEGCSSLTSIIIPDSVGYVDNEVFCNCTSLSSVTYLGELDGSSTAFSGCSLLEYVCVSDKYSGETFCGKTVKRDCEQSSSSSQSSFQSSSQSSTQSSAYTSSSGLPNPPPAVASYSSSSLTYPGIISIGFLFMAIHLIFVF